MFHAGVKPEKGFSLIELLIGIVIIGLLIAIIVPLDAAHRREALKATVKSDVRNTNANIINSLTKNPKADGFKLNDPSSGAPGTATNGISNVYSVLSKGNRIVVTDLATNGDPSTAPGDGAWNSYQITGTNPDVPGFYYTYISTIGQYRSSDGVEPGSGSPVASGPGAGNPTNAPIEGVMMTTWDTSLPNCSTIKLPIGAVANSLLDWGDGFIESGQAPNKVHKYTDTPGLKTVTFKGKFTHYGSMSDNTNNCLIRVDKWEDTGVQDLKGAFANASNLAYVAQLPSTVTSLTYAFADAGNFPADINKWDVSNVTNMDYTFLGAKLFNQPLNNWNVSNVTSMKSMFSVSGFNQPLNNWNVSNVTNISSMFLGSPFNQNINNWNVSNVTEMGGLFSSAKSFNQPLNNWNVSKATNMESVFMAAASFNQNINNWDVSNAKTTRLMFQGAQSFNQPLNNWNVSNSTNMDGMFTSASGFDQDINNWNVSKVTNMNSMFYGTNYVGPMNNWDVSNVTNMDNFLNQNYKYNKDLSSWNVTKVGSNHKNFAPLAPMTSAQLPKWAA